MFNEFEGAKEISDGIFLPTVWTALHENAVSWRRASMSFDTLKQRAAIHENDLALLGALSDTSASQWIGFCDATGWTAYGAIALSWCKGAELSQVWEIWETAGLQLKPIPEIERSARLINPALLSETNSLKKLIAISQNKPLPICLTIAAKGDALEIDLSDNMARSASPWIASFLKANMERRKDRTAKQAGLISEWTRVIKGTKFDI